MGDSFTDKTIEEGIGDSFRDRLDALDALGDSPKPKRRTHHSQEEPRESEPQHDGEKQPAKHKHSLLGVLGGDMLRSKFLYRQIPLAILIIAYLCLLIGNRYRVESLAKESIQLKERISFLREHRIQMQKEYQESITISTIASRLEPTGVGIIGGPPYEIKIDE